MKDLKDTIDLMNSNDFKDRFKAEYYQTKIRYDKLHEMIVNMKLVLFLLHLITPNCSLELLKHQASMMSYYLYDPEVRAEIEKIEL